MAVAAAVGFVERPKPSSSSSGGRGRSPALPDATPRLTAMMRRSMSTKRPDNGSDVQVVFAVVWTRTIRPFPRRSAVTNGVPSVRRTQVFSARSRDGSASTWRDTVTSLGISRPAKGLSDENGASRAGLLHSRAPPSARPPRRRRTGVNSSARSRASLGPAKRSSSPPFSTHCLRAPISPGLSA